MIAILWHLFSFAQADSSAANSARELLRLTGSAKIGVQMMNTMIASFKQHYTDVPDEFWDSFMNEVNMDELIEKIVPIYIKHYTQAELEELIVFYKTPLGQKVIQELPLISRESYSIGQDWGKQIAEKVISRMKEKGYIKST